MKIALISLVIGYAAFVWFVIHIGIKKHAFELERQRRAREHAAIEEKYMTPRMTDAEIAEMHASRWMGD